MLHYTQKTMTEKITFSFGKNWQQYLKESFNKKNVQLAKKSIKNFLRVKNLKGKTFLDIGCGSGLFSLSAYELGAKNIISFDVDPYSVKCCTYLRSKRSNPKNWQIYRGSILDNKFLSRIPKADIVYSWGVLHHTGRMWIAIENAAKKVKKGGYFYFTIYNKKPGLRGSKNQLKLKRLYNQSPHLFKKFLEWSLWGSFITKNLLFFRNPFKIIKNIENSTFARGMTFKSGVTDWLGGLPYEFATPQEIFDFCNKKLKLQLINVHIVDETNALGNNHFLFKK